MIKEGFASAEVRLLDSGGLCGGLDVRWRTAKGLELRILANFINQDIAVPTAFGGECLWQLGQVRGRCWARMPSSCCAVPRCQPDHFTGAPFGDVEQSSGAGLSEKTFQQK